MDQRPNVKSKTLTVLEENKGEKLQDIGFGNDFLNVTPKKEQTTEKKKQTNWTENHLGIKSHSQQSEKATHGMEKKICKSYI